MIDLGELRRHSFEKLLLDKALQDYESIFVVAKNWNLSGVLDLEKDVVVHKLRRNFRDGNFWEGVTVSLYPEVAEIRTYQMLPVNRDESKECGSSIDSGRLRPRL
jgi:hypothetical protein